MARTRRFSLALLGALAATACAAAPDDRGAQGSSDLTAERAQVVGAEQSTAGAAIPKATCGEGPFVELAAWTLELADRGESPLEGARLTFDVCPGYSVASNEFGIATAHVPRGVPVVTRISAPGHVTAIVSQSVLASDSIVTDLLPALAHADAIPGYAADKPSFALFVVAAGTGPCAYDSGVSVAVVEHPEIHALYMPPSWPYDAVVVNATATQRGGVAFVPSLAAGERVHVTASKPGCRARTVASEQTGEFVLENGAWTVGNVYVDDP